MNQKAERTDLQNFPAVNIVGSENSSLNLKERQVKRGLALFVNGLSIALSLIGYTTTVLAKEPPCEPPAPYEFGQTYGYDMVANPFAKDGHLGEVYDRHDELFFDPDPVLVGQVRGFFPVLVDGKWQYRLINTCGLPIKIS